MSKENQPEGFRQDGIVLGDLKINVNGAVGLKKAKPLHESATCDIVEELRGRAGVQEIRIDPHAPYVISRMEPINSTGPCIILVVED